MPRRATAAIATIFTGPSGSRVTRAPSPRYPPREDVSDRGGREELREAVGCGPKRPVVEEGRVLRHEDAQAVRNRTGPEGRRFEVLVDAEKLPGVDSDCRGDRHAEHGFG